MKKNNSDLNNKRIEQFIKKAKKLIREGQDVSIETKRKNQEDYGIASLTIDGRIAVFDGAEDGSDDKIYTIKEFKKKYEILRLINEYEKEL